MEQPCAEERDAAVQEGLRRSNARFMLSMSRILERYNHPFEDDLLVSLDTLTYDTPEGPKRWEQVSRKEVKKLKKEMFKRNRRRQWNTEISKQQSSDFEDEHSTVQQESSENSRVDTSDSGAESGDIVRRKFQDIHLQVTPPHSSKGHCLTSPVKEPFGNQVAVCRKKLELLNECSSSIYQQLQHSGALSSSNTIGSPRHKTGPELSLTLCDSILGEYQSADEECSWSNTTLGDLYPSMVEIFSKLMTKHSQRKVLKYMLGHLMFKRWHSRRPKLNVTLGKMREFRPFKLKKAFHSTSSCRSEDSQSPTFGNKNREFSCDNCLISNSSDLVPYTDTNEIEMGYSNSSLEHLALGKGQEVYIHTAFTDVMDRMGKTFLVEDELQTTVSPRNSEYAESEKLAYKRFSEPSFVTSTASSYSRALHVKKSETQKTDFCVVTSEVHSSACSSPGNSNNYMPITNCSPARSSNTAFMYPEKIISERHKGSFSSWIMKHSPSKTPKKNKDAFDELYYTVCSGKFQKSLTLTRPLINSWNLEEKGRLVKSNFGWSTEQLGIEFDSIHEKLCSKSVPKFLGFQTASNFRKYEEIQMPETVNALVNSPVRTYSAISRVKRTGNVQNYLLSPEKRQKLIPGHCFTSKKCQELPLSIKSSLQTAGMDLLSNYSKPRFIADHKFHCQGSGSHDSSDKTFLDTGTSLQESGTADVHPFLRGAMENCSSLSNVKKHHRRVYRKLSYTDEKDQLKESLG
ncbi:PREDICTED: Holliday junction recognition protein [Ficedula albicollis]|uniref:Holliday junction recognition protein n=1 Tax=Ficedula albicollis TaxID=59894 RepID=U3JV31_FICAL|nr:PREDICTED: Holliday junction recognition protein [Ficedula albicollis]